MNKLAKYLNQHLVGNVFDSAEILEDYSTDRSVLKITPRMVAIPENVSDVRRIVRFANQLSAKNIRLPITVRGSGLDKTGADLGNGLVLSTEHLNRIQEIDDHSRFVRCEAGVTLGQLNSALGLYGLTVPVFADPRETIGGLISNFITDPAAGKYNGIYYYVDCVEAILSTGDAIQTGRFYKRNLERKKNLTSFEGTVYRETLDLIQDNIDLVRDLGGRNTIDASGYQMLTQVYRERNRSFDLLPLFYASQGTLGIITEVILRCEVRTEGIKHFIAAFESISAALNYIEQLDPLEPLELSLYDARIFKAAADHGKDPSLFAPKFNKGYLVLAGFDDRPRKAQKKLSLCLDMLPNNAAAVMETEDNTKDFKRFHSAVLSFLNNDVHGERSPLVDDFYVPSEHLANFITELKTLEKAYSMELPIYGSYSTSNYCVRPDINLGTVAGRQFIMKFLRDFNALLKSYGGSITGGAPEGRVKASVVNKNFSEDELALYNKVKSIFDPNRIFNPDVKQGATESVTIRALRTSPNSGIVTE